MFILITMSEMKREALVSECLRGISSERFHETLATADVASVPQKIAPHSARYLCHYQILSDMTFDQLEDDK